MKQKMYKDKTHWIQSGNIKANSNYLFQSQKKSAKSLPQKTYSKLSKPAEKILAWEPILRLLRPLISYCKKQAQVVNADLDFLPMALGEYDALPPENVYKEASNDYRHNEHYTVPSQGDMNLLEAHAQMLRQLTGYNYQPDNILITSGGLDACRNAILFLSGLNDEICFVEPSWPNSKTLALACGRNVSTVSLDAENNFALPQSKNEWDELVPKSVDLLWLEVPGNPYGRGWQSKQEMQTLADFVKARGIIAFVDEEYRLLYANGQPKTILELAAPGIVTSSSWDKIFCMTSARLGTLETADPVLMKMFLPLGNLMLSAPNFMRLQQHIAKVLQQDGLPYLLGFAKEIEANRDIVEKTLSTAPGSYLRGSAAFYDGWFIPELRSGGSMQALLHSLLTIAQDLRDKKQPAITTFTNAVPWNEFYQDDGAEGYRITISRSQEQGLEQAISALKDQVDTYIQAGQPSYGPVEKVVEQFLAGEVIEPAKSWPKEIKREREIERKLILQPQEYLVGP